MNHNITRRRVYDNAPWFDLVLSVLLALAAVAFCLIGEGCGDAAVRRQVQAAEIKARLFNAALPLWINAYEDECSGAIDNAPPAEAQAALHRCVAKWSRVKLAWESMRVAHNAWRRGLEQCRRTGSNTRCTTLTVEHAQVFLRAVDDWRCVVRRAGHAELDKFPGSPDCAEGQ